MIIDAHHHLWHYTDEEFGWIADDCLRHNFTVDDLGRLIGSSGVDRTIVCEARQTIEETDWLLELAEGMFSPPSYRRRLGDRRGNVCPERSELRRRRYAGCRPAVQRLSRRPRQYGVLQLPR